MTADNNESTATDWQKIPIEELLAVARNTETPLATLHEILNQIGIIRLGDIATDRTANPVILGLIADMKSVHYPPSLGGGGNILGIHLARNPATPAETIDQIFDAAIASPDFNIVKAVLNNPSSLLRTLLKALPTQASFEGGWPVRETFVEEAYKSPYLPMNHVIQSFRWLPSPHYTNFWLVLNRRKIDVLEIIQPYLLLGYGIEEALILVENNIPLSAAEETKGMPITWIVGLYDGRVLAHREAYEAIATTWKVSARILSEQLESPVIVANQ
jgi:hypothetical protein